MSKVKGSYLVRCDINYGFCLPGDLGSRYLLWTNNIKYENDGSITFEPINTNFSDDWPLSVNIHISNCVIFKMKE